MMQINKLGVFSSMHQENEKYLKHPKLVQLFDRYATYNGSDPYRAPAVLNMIPHLEHGIGTFCPNAECTRLQKAFTIWRARLE